MSTVSPAREIGVACGTIMALVAAVSIVMSAGMGTVIGCILVDAFLIFTLYADEQPTFAGIPEYDDV